MSHMEFFDNVVVITGASRGIGRELALQLSDHKALLALGAREGEKLEQVAEECRRRGGETLAVATDVSDAPQCKNLVERTVQRYGRIDTLFNNAGITMWGRFDRLRDLSVMDTLVKINYLGSVYCTYYALPYLTETRGRIVAVCSLAGKTGLPLRSGYAASKHAMCGFFESLRIELAEDEVTVTLVHPDFVATETRERALGPSGEPLGKSPVREAEVMTAEACARRIIHAAGQRKRELLMSLRGQLGLWVKLLAPEIVDLTARKAIEKGR